jgi:hypothetical protein
VRGAALQTAQGNVSYSCHHSSRTRHIKTTRTGSVPPGSADLLTETGATRRDTLIRSLGLALAGHGSSRRMMVGTTGFEPATS